eukprot:5221520-Prorocentrum_lima.AAC.1
MELQKSLKDFVMGLGSSWNGPCKGSPSVGSNRLLYIFPGADPNLEDMGWGSIPQLTSAWHGSLSLWKDLKDKGGSVAGAI